jgi:nicotinamide-nucleotide amidase
VKLNVICIGNEILLGHTLNTNLAFIGDALHAEGYLISREFCIPDDAVSITDTLNEALADSDVVVTVGGLGPTCDDITRPTVAAALGQQLVYQPRVLEGIKAYLASRNVVVPDDALRRQSMVPEGAEIVPNHNGTAPGLWCRRGHQVVIMLPGPPSELRPMVAETVVPGLKAQFPADVATRTIRTCGRPESLLADEVENFLKMWPCITPAYCARPFMVDVRLSSAASDEPQLEAATAALVGKLGTAVFPADCLSLQAAVGKLLREQGLTVATAESCTGGKIAAALTDVPGASGYFVGGMVTYANSWKQCQLGVKPETLENYGAVSRETAGEMLEGLLARCGCDAGIAVTGIAGPEGGTQDKPVGLVYIATALGEKRQIRRVLFPGNRDSVRERTVTVALNELRIQLLQNQMATGLIGQE